MTTAQFPAEVLERAGLSPAEAGDWAASAPGPHGSFEAAAEAVSAFLARGQGLIQRLPDPARRTVGERAARAAIAGMMDGARDSFLSSHAADLYDAVTGCGTRSLRLEELLREAAARVPGLVPTPAQMDAERARPLPEKEGIELAQGLLAGHVLAAPRAGRHLIDAIAARR